MRLAVLWVAFSLDLAELGNHVRHVRPPAGARGRVPPRLETWNDAFPPLAEPWQLAWWLLDVHTGNMLAYPYGGNHFGSTLTTILVVAGCIRMRAAPRAAGPCSSCSSARCQSPWSRPPCTAIRTAPAPA